MPIDSIRHSDKRTNIPTAELRDLVLDRAIRMRSRRMILGERLLVMNSLATRNGTAAAEALDA